jgi:hypothetical protein
MGRERVTEHVTGNLLSNPSHFSGAAYSSLKGIFKNMVSPPHSCFPIPDKFSRWKDVLPLPRSGQIGIFAGERVRKGGVSISGIQIAPMALC